MSTAACVTDGIGGDGRGDDAGLSNEALVRGNMQVVNGEIRKIPRPLNAFMLFSNEMRKQLKQQFPGEPNNMISTRLGTAWKSLSEEEKKKYHEMAHKEDLEHRRKYPNYQYCPGQARRMKRVRREQRRHLTQANRANRQPGRTLDSAATCQQCCSSMSLSHQQSLSYGINSLEVGNNGKCSAQCSLSAGSLQVADKSALSPQRAAMPQGPGVAKPYNSFHFLPGHPSITSSGFSSGDQALDMAAGEGPMPLCGSYKHMPAPAGVHDPGSSYCEETRGVGLPPMTHATWASDQHNFLQYPQYLYIPDHHQYGDRYSWTCCGTAPVHMALEASMESRVQTRYTTCCNTCHFDCQSEITADQHECCGYTCEGWHMGADGAPTPPPINVATPVSVNDEVHIGSQAEPTYTVLGETTQSTAKLGTRSATACRQLHPDSDSSDTS